jgi:hypothetical protein
MNNPDHISESLETIFGVKILNSESGHQDGKKSDPGWKKFGIQDKHLGSEHSQQLK